VHVIVAQFRQPAPEHVSVAREGQQAVMLGQQVFSFLIRITIGAQMILLAFFRLSVHIRSGGFARGQVVIGHDGDGFRQGRANTGPLLDGIHNPVNLVFRSGMYPEVFDFGFLSACLHDCYPLSGLYADRDKYKHGFVRSQTDSHEYLRKKV
jgi:hypothetical protein